MRRTVDLLGGWKRVGTILIVGTGLMWASLAITANTVFGRSNPDLAGMFGWSGTEARVGQAQALIALDSPPAKLARAEALARGALQRELLNARAASTIGSVAALRHDTQGAGRMFRFSETITRRDLSTELWLIEDAVSRGDTDKALRHYDRAMSVSVPSWDLLVPVLSTASAEPPIARALANRLRRRPNWWRAFIDRFISTNPAPATAFPLILPALRLNPRDAIDRPYIVRAVEKLVDVGAYEAAWTLYRQATGAPATSRQALRNGEFESENLVSPFDWQLVDGEGLSASIRSREADGPGSALYLSADAGRTGVVARQLLLLGEGRYIFSGQAGRVPSDADRPEVTLACARSGSPIARLVIPPAGDQGKRFATAFNLPANCSSQWLSIRARAPFDTSAPETWIDALTVRRG